jgi:hypothetical protein
MGLWAAKPTSPANGDRGKSESAIQRSYFECTARTRSVEDFAPFVREAREAALQALALDSENPQTRLRRRGAGRRAPIATKTRTRLIFSAAARHCDGHARWRRGRPPAPPEMSR